MSNLDYEKLWAFREKTLEEFIARYQDAYAGICAFKRFEADKLMQKDGRYVVAETDGEKFPHGKPILKQLPVLDQYLNVPFYKDVIEFLLDFIDQDNFDAIVELGSGMGTNLIEMFYRGGPRDIPYYAAEFTESGTRMARNLASHCPEMKFRCFRFDYNAPDLSAVEEKRKVLFFTHHSIEQVQDISVDLIETIAGHAENVVCIHLEPFGWQLADFDGPPSRDQAEQCTKKGWNRNLFVTLRSATEAGVIQPTFMAKNVMGGEYANPTSISIWQNK